MPDPRPPAKNFQFLGGFDDSPSQPSGRAGCPAPSEKPAAIGITAPRVARQDDDAEAMLDALAEALDVGVEPAPELAQWFVRAARSWQACESQTLDQAMGLTPGPGGFWRARRRVELLARRDALIRELLERLGGVSVRTASQLADLLNRPVPPASVRPLVAMREVVQVPTSARQLYRCAAGDRSA